MNLLAFDTCFDACSVAVQCGSTGAVSCERELMRRGHAEALLPMIERTMRAAGLRYGELDRIAVTHGPGTFTGTRVGMSAALGLSFAHRLPVATYSSLECQARGVLDVLGEHLAGFDGILVARDAKRGSLLVEGIDLTGEALCAPALLDIGAARQLADQRRWFVAGSGVPYLVTVETGFENDMSAVSETLLCDRAEPDARFLLRDAGTRPPNPLPAPLYLRPPDATPSSRPALARQHKPGFGDA
mgnify:CR=1 FL=1